MRYVLVVPTLNPRPDKWREWVACVRRQSQLPVATVVVDSGSSDEAREYSIQSGFDVLEIDRKEFDHGGTRNNAFKYAVDRYSDIDAIVFLTQDSYLEGENAVSELLKALEVRNTAVAYGRQIQAINANCLASHARYYNYPPISRVYSLSDREPYGIGAVFCSNSFSAYSVEHFKRLGGFPEKNILGEDMLFACKALSAGLNNAYVSSAVTRHSHNYSLMEEFSRYFDTGVFHSINQEILVNFSGVKTKGVDYVKSELNYLLSRRSKYLFIVPFFWFAKMFGYALGRRHKYFTRRFNKFMSMHKSYWI